MKNKRRKPAEKDILRDTLEERFEIIRLLGKGGMANVYLAHETALDRDVAIKVLPRSLSGDERFIGSFKREARISARLEHPNIVRIYQITEENRFCYIVMNYIPGELLSDHIKKHSPLTVKDIIRWASDICAALEYAHAHGVIHRDLKPGNIILNKDDSAVVLDFGIAQAVNDSDIASQGIVKGTLNYMSPEQAWGREIDHRSDIYGLGLLLYEITTASLPFEASDEFDLMCKMTRDAPEPPKSRNKNIPQWLNDIILTCLEPDPDARFEHVSEVHGKINEYADQVSAVKFEATESALPADLHEKEAVILSLVRNKLHSSTLATSSKTDSSRKPLQREDVSAGKMKEFSSFIDTIPVLPAHVYELLSGLYNDEVDADKLVDVVSSDPAIVCNILKTVNSTYFGLARKTENLKFAIVYLGLNAVKKIALKTSFSNTYKADWSYRGNTTRGLWEHSYLVSSCAESLVSSNDSEYIGNITTLGILHDIGKYLIFRLMVELNKKKESQVLNSSIPGSLVSVEQEENLFSINHAILGSLLAEKWGLPDRIFRVLEYHHHPSFWPAEMIPKTFVKDATVICFSDIIVNSIITKQRILPEPAHEYFDILDLKPPLENIVTDALLMDLARARMFTALIN